MCNCKGRGQCWAEADGNHAGVFSLSHMVKPYKGSGSGTEGSVSGTRSSKTCTQGASDMRLQGPCRCVETVCDCVALVHSDIFRACMGLHLVLHLLQFCKDISELQGHGQHDGVRTQYPLHSISVLQGTIDYHSKDNLVTNYPVFHSTSNMQRRCLHQACTLCAVLQVYEATLSPSAEMQLKVRRRSATASVAPGASGSPWC